MHFELENNLKKYEKNKNLKIFKKHFDHKNNFFLFEIQVQK